MTSLVVEVATTFGEVGVEHLEENNKIHEIINGVRVRVQGREGVGETFSGQVQRQRRQLVHGRVRGLWIPVDHHHLVHLIMDIQRKLKEDDGNLIYLIQLYSTFYYQSVKQISS